MDTSLFFLYSIAYCGLLIWGIFLANKYTWWTLANVTLLVIAALIYDNLIVGLGRYLGEGTILQGLNYGRYWLHAFFTPLLVLFALYSVTRCNVEWVKKSWTKLGAIFLVIGLSILEIVTGIIGGKLEPEWKYGVLSYHISNKAGPPLMVMIVTLFLLLAAIVLWRKIKWRFLMIALLIMAFGGALQKFVNSSALNNGFELILMVSIMGTKQRLDNHK